jgi:hypothetical protein
MCERVKEGLQKAGRGTGAGGMVSSPRGNPGKEAGDAPRYVASKFVRFGPAS